MQTILEFTFHIIVTVHPVHTILEFTGSWTMTGQRSNCGLNQTLDTIMLGVIGGGWMNSKTIICCIQTMRLMCTIFITIHSKHINHAWCLLNKIVLPKKFVLLISQRRSNMDCIGTHLFLDYELDVQILVTIKPKLRLVPHKHDLNER